MKARTSIAAIGTAAVLGVTGAFTLPAIASATIVTHTVQFTTVQQKTISFSKASGAADETIVNNAGKVIGFGTLYFSVNPKAHLDVTHETFTLSGGFLYGVLTFGPGAKPHGTVTGGTGLYTGATGTIAVRNIGVSGTRIGVTITYHV